MFIGAGEKHVAGFSSVNIQAEKDIVATDNGKLDLANAGGLRLQSSETGYFYRRSPEHRQCDWKNKYRALGRRRAADGSRHRRKTGD